MSALNEDEAAKSASYWCQAKDIVTSVDVSRAIVNAKCPVPDSYQFSKDIRQNETLFFRGSPAAGQTSRLLRADLSETAPSSTVGCERHDWKEPTTDDGPMSCACCDRGVSNLPRAQWREVFQQSPRSSSMTREEQLIRERQRSSISGISSFHQNSAGNAFLFAASGSVYLSCRTVETTAGSASLVRFQNSCSVGLLSVIL